MTVEELAKYCSFEVLTGTESLQREVSGGVYCCDLLSLVMGRAPADGGWVTVMGNINAVAVASLADTACMVLAEGMPADAEAAARAQQQDIAILRTDLPVFEAATAMSNALAGR